MKKLRVKVVKSLIQKLHMACMTGVGFTLRQPGYRALHDWLMALSKDSSSLSHRTLARSWNLLTAPATHQWGLCLYLRVSPNVSPAWTLPDSTSHCGRTPNAHLPRERGRGSWTFFETSPLEATEPQAPAFERLKGLEEGHLPNPPCWSRGMQRLGDNGATQLEPCSWAHLDSALLQSA